MNIEENLVIYTEEDEKIKKRKEIKEIEKDVIKTTEMFREMNKLIEENQYNIDCIESTISTVKENVDISRENIEKAEKYNKKSRYIKIGLYSTIATCVGFPVGIIYGTKTAIGVISCVTLTYFIK